MPVLIHLVGKILLIPEKYYPLTFYTNATGVLTPVSGEQQSQLVRWRLSTFWVCLVGYVGYYLCRGNLSAAFPLLEQEFGYSNTQLGLIASLSEIAYATGKFINGPLADKVGGRRIFLIGMAGAIFWNLIFALSSSLTAFIIVWCMCRYFLSMGWGGLTKTIGNWYPPERNGTIMGLISVNFQFGGIAATLFAAFLVYRNVSWQGLFIYPAIVLTVIFVWSAIFSKSSPKDVLPDVTLSKGDDEKAQIADYGEENDPSIKVIIKALLGLPIYRQLLVFSFLTTMLRSVFFFWTPMFLVDIGLNVFDSILQSAIFSFLGVLGTVLIGWYTDNYAKNGDRARTMWLMLVCLVVSLAAIALISSSEEPNYSLILVFLGSSGFFLLGPYSMSSGCLTLDIAGAKGAGSCTGIIDGLGYIGGAIAAFGAGYLSDILGWSQVFVVLAGLAAISTVSAYMMSKEFQRISLSDIGAASSG